MGTGTSITIFLSFHKPKCLLTTFFIPDNKWVGSLWRLLFLDFAVTGAVALTLFSSLYTLVFFACKKNTSSNKRVNFRDTKIKYMINLLMIRIPVLLTPCPRVNKKTRYSRFSSVWTLTFSNPQTPNSDKELISPYNIIPKLNIKVMIIEEMITKKKSSWLLSKFSLSEHREKYGEYAYILMLECKGLKTDNRECMCID